MKNKEFTNLKRGDLVKYIFFDNGHVLGIVMCLKDGVCFIKWTDETDIRGHFIDDDTERQNFFTMRRQQ